MEHAFLEQAGKNFTAVSTMKMLDLVNRSSKKVYKLTPQNQSVVLPNLKGYTQSKLDDFKSRLNNGSLEYVYLPEIGNYVVGDWKGSGWIEMFTPLGAEDTHQGGSNIISGDYKGGYTESFNIDNSDIVINGEDFYSLNLVRSYSSQRNNSKSVLGLGWQHADDNKISLIHTDIEAAYGLRKKEDMAAAVTAITVVV